MTDDPFEDAQARFVRSCRLAAAALDKAAATNPAARLYPATAGVRVDGLTNDEQRELEGIGRHRLTALRDAAETGDPMAAISAFMLAPLTLNDLPDWAALYLFERFQEIDNLKSAPPPDMAEAVGRALGFIMQRGQRSPFTESYAYHRDLDYARAVHRRIVALGDKPGIAIEEVARETGVSKSTITRAWHEHKARVAGVASGNPPIS